MAIRLRVKQNALSRMYLQNCTVESKKSFVGCKILWYSGRNTNATAITRFETAISGIVLANNKKSDSIY